MKARMTFFFTKLSLSYELRKNKFLGLWGFTSVV